MPTQKQPPTVLNKTTYRFIISLVGLAIVGFLTYAGSVDTNTGVALMGGVLAAWSASEWGLRREPADRR